MNSSLAPFGPRTRNSEMIKSPGAATFAGGSPPGETLIPITLLSLTLPRVRGAGAGAGAGTSVVVLATGVTAAGPETVGSAYAPKTTTDGATVFFFFFLVFRDEELLVVSAFAGDCVVWV